MTDAHSAALFQRARDVIPGGVNSPVRAYAAVGGTPRFIERGAGPYVWDVDGNRYLDYVMSWGPLIHGHAFGPVVNALEGGAAFGTSFGAPTAAEVDLAEIVVRCVPSMEMVRLVNSGTEATMSAIRLARAATGRDRIVKFAGNYHGHVDSLLARSGSGSLSLGIPTSPGIPESVVAQTSVLPFNDAEAVEREFQSRGGEIAAVIVEPIAGNMGVVPPQPGFLETIRRVTSSAGGLFIADEVITCFRVALGGAQELLKFSPDLTTLGKIIGGGLPVGAYGGRRDLMEGMAPVGDIYQAGTLSGNPLATSAGLANLLPLQEDGFYAALNALTQRLADGLRHASSEAGLPVTVNATTGMLTLFFNPGPVVTLEDAQRSHTQHFARFFHAMLDHGIMLPPSQFEAWMVSSAHTEEIIDETIGAAEMALRTIG